MNFKVYSEVDMLSNMNFFPQEAQHKRVLWSRKLLFINAHEISISYRKQAKLKIPLSQTGY